MIDIEIAQLTDRMMRRIHASLNARAQEFDHHHVGPAGGILLLTLAENEPARLQDMVRHMARDKAQITRQIQTLESKGLVQRQGLEEDGRVSILSLTPEGHQAVADIQRAVAGVLSEILSPLTESDRLKLKDILGQL